MRVQSISGSSQKPILANIVSRHRGRTRSTIWSAACVALLGVGFLPAASVRAERWTSLHTSRTVEAEFVGMWGNSVILKMPGNRRVTVNVDDLVAESRILARKLADRQNQDRRKVLDAIRAEADEAAAPAPTPIPRPADPPGYQSFSGGGGVLSKIEWFEQQKNNGHLIAVFDALPPSYQVDLQRLVRASMQKVDIDSLNQLIGSVHMVGDMVVTRQRWLFSHPRLEGLQGESKEALESFLLAIGGLIRDGVDPKTLNLEGLQTTPLRDWLLELDQRMAPHLYSIQELTRNSGAIPEPSYEVLNEKGDSATIQVSQGPMQRRVEFTRVEDTWIDADTVANWKDMIAQWEASIENVADGSLLADPQIQMFPGAVQALLQPAMSANSAKEFHSAMDTWLAMAQPAMASMQQMAAMNGMGGGRGNTRAGNPYGESEFDDPDDLYSEDDFNMGGEEGPPEGFEPGMSPEDEGDDP